MIQTLVAGPPPQKPKWSNGWTLQAQNGPIVKLPVVQKGWTRELVDVGGSHVAVQGAQTKDILGQNWQWVLPFVSLIDIEYDAIQQFRDHRQGLGPYWFTDPTFGGCTTLVNLISFPESSQLRGKHDCTLTLQEVSSAYRQS